MEKFTDMINKSSSNKWIILGSMTALTLGVLAFRNLNLNEIDILPSHGMYRSIDRIHNEEQKIKTVREQVKQGALDKAAEYNQTMQSSEIIISASGPKIDNIDQTIRKMKKQKSKNTQHLP